MGIDGVGVCVDFGCSSWLYSLVGWLTLVIWKEMTVHSYFPLRHVALNVWCWMTQCWSVQRRFLTNHCKLLKDNVIGATHTHTPPPQMQIFGPTLFQNQQQPQLTVLYCTFLMALWHTLLCKNSLGDQLKLARKKLHNRQKVSVKEGCLYWLDL